MFHVRYKYTAASGIGSEPYKAGVIMSNVPVLDLVFAILIFIMIIHGYAKGFVGEVFSWAALVLSLLAAVIFYPRGSEFIRARVMENVRYVPEILAFIIIFLFVMFLVRMIERVFRDFVNKTKMGGVDKILGAFFGLMEGVVLSALIIFVLVTIRPLADFSKAIDDSVLAQILLPIIMIPINRGRETIQVVFHLLPGMGIPGFYV